MTRDLDAIYTHYKDWCTKLRLRPASREKYLSIIESKLPHEGAIHHTHDNVREMIASLPHH